MKIEEFALKISEDIKSEIIKWHSFSSLPLKGSLWEERIHKVFIKNDLGSDWVAGSHAPGKDIKAIHTPFSFSAKSAKITGTKVGISSFRTTKYKTLDEKIHFHDQVGKNFSHYFLILRQENKQGETVYTPCLLDSGHLSAAKCVWEKTHNQKTRKHSGWVGLSEGYKMKISKPMSDQFWYEMSFDDMLASSHVLCNLKFARGKDGALVYVGD